MPSLAVVSLLSLLFALNSACSASSGAAASGHVERFQGRITATGQGAGATAFITLEINRYADDREIAELAKLLREGGQDAMVAAIAGKEPAGWMRIGSGLRYHLRVIRSVDTPDGGRVVVALTDRAIRFGEVVRMARSQSYPLAMVDLVLDATDSGTGRLIPAAQIRFADGSAELVSYGAQPFVLRTVEPLQ